MKCKSKIFLFSSQNKSDKTMIMHRYFNPKREAVGVVCTEKQGTRVVHDLDGNNINLSCFFQACIETISKSSVTFDVQDIETTPDLSNKTDPKLASWIVLDELEKLELYNQGFESMFSNFLNKYLHLAEPKANLLVAVSDTSMEALVSKYELEKAVNIDLNDLLLWQTIDVVVLAGGKSTRMGTDKAMMCYHHDQPQYLRLHDELSKYFGNIWIASGNRVYSGVDCVQDQYDFKGPLNGLLSAAKESNALWLLAVGIDYPLITIEDILLLVSKVNEAYDVICYRHDDGVAEPLLTLYQKSFFLKSNQYLNDSNPSIQNIISRVNLLSIPLAKNHNIKSFDSKQI